MNKATESPSNLGMDIVWMHQINNILIPTQYSRNIHGLEVAHSLSFSLTNTAQMAKQSNPLANSFSAKSSFLQVQGDRWETKE